ncbi:SusC/RagA family TonB-linked outer membrane protein [Flavobacterium sp. XS2P24]|uniref:SusC/RagA family TonB-linked outer membrane protein n=1 Tax=Flavobacterium sp. XS2P24 TaxID=3041249 RepID=UPI0024A7F047|nr:SusC/RagA family TonB-linked outer membrane protein [Flavobacterium sp. XS2P24]MDI6048576.1 SusC/RagA family TonB-linked outer membrane protein [Flavobacterium sp. XS2P24]
MKNSLIKGLMVFLTMLCTSLTYSQDVSGTVSDASGPLPGASILVKGTTNGAQTDFDGKFTIKNVGSNAVLVFSYIGLKTQEVNVAGKSTVNVVLKEDSAELKEVVVIGYGSVRKKDATGAVDQIGAKDFDNVSSPSPAQLLRGKVAGVQVTQSSGEPGAGVAIRVRGNSSIRSGNGPLIVIDGVPLDGGNVSAGGDNLLGASSAKNPLNFVNQNDIESISVLKDASSTAIYGSRGANGVIVITTKKGKSKEPQLTYSSSVQFSKMSGNFDVMNADEFVAAGGDDKGSRSYNWKDAVLRNGFSMNHDLSFSKTTENSNTRVSFGASNTDGIVKNTGLDKYSASFYNSNDFFGGALKVESRVIYASLKDETTILSNDAGFIGNIIGTALYWNPTLPINNSNGSYNSISNTYLNPVELLNSYKDYTNTNKLLGSINTTWKITSKLKYQFLFGIESSTSTRKSQLLPTMRILDVATAAVPGSTDVKYGQANIASQNKFNKTFEHTLNYNNDFSDNFNLDALVGYSYYDYTADGSGARGRGYDNAQTNLIDNIEGGLQNEFRVSSYRNRVELQSYFGRVNATLYKRLILTGTIRSDGSTKLGVNNKYDYFPSVGVAYKVIDNKEGLVNSFKIRGNYGITGNQEFSPNSAIARASYGNNGTLGVDSNANADLKWETTKSYGVGTDFELFNNRLTGSLDYFQRDTKDLIFPVPAAATQPGPPSPRFKNLPGNLINKGVEVSLNYKVIDTEDLTWDVSGNASFLENKMTNFAGFISTGGLNGQGLSGAYAQVISNDKPIYSYYMYEWRGYDSTGNSIYADASGNDTGLGTAAKSILDKQPLPKINVGFSTNLAYKGFDASASFYGAFGHYIYNNTTNAYFFKGAFLGGRNVTNEAATSAQAQGDPNSPSTKYLEKGDFLRMGNLTFGYTVKGAILERFKIKSARFYVNGSNLFVITNYTGSDPEVDTDKSLNGVPSAGMEYLSYPREKSVAVGLNVTF